METMFALIGFAILYIGRGLLSGLRKIGLFDATPGLDKMVLRLSGSILAVASIASLAFGAWRNWRKLEHALDGLSTATGHEAVRLLDDARSAVFILLLPTLAVGGLLALVVWRNVEAILAGKQDEQLRDIRLVRDNTDFDYDRDIAFWKGVHK